MRRKNCFKTKAKPSLGPNVLNGLLRALHGLRPQTKRETSSPESREKTFFSQLSSLYIYFNILYEKKVFSHLALGLILIIIFFCVCLSVNYN
jgi:hypothetical protein